MTKVGIIGGSGLYSLELLTDRQEVAVKTPFGDPSDLFITGRMGDVECVFVPRHGRRHQHIPTEVPYRANIYALKQMGVSWVISVSAVGSMREDIKPGNMVLPDQFIDRTTQRVTTFFGNGAVAHVSLADPICNKLQQHLARSIESCDITSHRNGTYLCIEGPAFSTRAESQLFRSWGVSVIGMTAMPEARLAREAGLHYATIALATDYDCWHADEKAVSASAVLETLRNNSDNVQRVLSDAIPNIVSLDTAKNKDPQGDFLCGCDTALQTGLMTPKEHMPLATQDRLSAILAQL